MKKFKRRTKINLSIKTAFQIRLIMKVMFIVLLGTLVTSLVFYFYASQEVGSTFKQFHINARSFLDYLLPAILTSAGLGIVVSMIISVFFPHAVAGPLYRIEKELKNRIGTGDLTCKFTVRERDEFKDLVDNLNLAIGVVRSNVEIIETASNDLGELICNNGTPDLKEVREVQQRLSSAIGNFKIR